MILLVNSNIDSAYCPLTMQGVLQSCHATVLCSADPQEKSEWSAGTCLPRPSQTQAFQGLSGGEVHFLPLFPSELWLPNVEVVRQDEKKFRGGGGRFSRKISLRLKHQIF